MIARSFVLAAICLSFVGAGCAKGPKDKLQGKWVGDRIDNVPAEQVVRATGWVKGTTFAFAGDKMTVAIPAEQPRSGSFEVAKTEGQTLVLAVKGEGRPAEETRLTLAEDGGSLRWDIGEGREVVLVRAQ